MTEADREVERLRAAFQAVPNAVETDGRDCPCPEALWAAAHGELPAAERRRIVDHTVTCAGCAEAWRVARELQPPSTVAAAGGWWGRGASGWRLAAAAAAVSVVAAMWLLLPRDTRDRGAPVGVAGDGAIVSLIEEGEVLPRTRCLLRWSRGPEGATYSIEVASEDLQAVARAHGLERPEYTVPESALQDLPAGAKIVWQVRVHLVDGTSRSSPSYVNRLE